MIIIKYFIPQWKGCGEPNSILRPRLKVIA